MNARPAPTLLQTEAAREEAALRWQHFNVETVKSVSLGELTAAHATIHQVAENISGETTDCDKRAILYFSVYEDSGGNFMFPLVATHGSLWGVTHTLWLEGWVRRLLLPLSPGGTVQRWLDALDAVRDINRRVFVEVYSTFYFTRYYGSHPQAGELIKPEVLALYNRVHEAIARDEPLSYEERRDVYRDIFQHEQDDIVDPGIQDAVAMCANPAFVRPFAIVSPRFRYFPKGQRLFFTDFTSVDQRNREGLRALAFAEEVGTARVLEAMGEYGV
jgi:hypothetical protein